MCPDWDSRPMDSMLDNTLLVSRKAWSASVPTLSTQIPTVACLRSTWSSTQFTALSNQIPPRNAEKLTKLPESVSVISKESPHCPGVVA